MSSTRGALRAVGEHRRWQGQPDSPGKGFRRALGNTLAKLGQRAGAIRAKGTRHPGPTRRALLALLESCGPSSKGNVFVWRGRAQYPGLRLVGHISRTLFLNGLGLKPRLIPTKNVSGTPLGGLNPKLGGGDNPHLLVVRAIGWGVWVLLF